jgi:hypothetical protein
MSLFSGYDREGLRRMYVTAWRKSTAHQILEPLEAQIVAVIAEHPEYLRWLEGEETALAGEFPPEAGRQNPFLHMGLHLAIREQVSTDRPPGIALVHRKLAARLGDAHAAEHAMLEPLAEALWQAQRSGLPPDERSYLERLTRLAQ